MNRRTNLAILLAVALAGPAAAQTTLRTYSGSAASDLNGRSVAGAGDVNGDGVGDLIVGEPGDDTGGTDAGAAFVYSGATGALVWSFYGGLGPGGGDALGHSVAGAGDVNGDGRADVIVGVPNDDTLGLFQNGTATVYSGATGAVLFTREGGASNLHFGWSVAGAGNVNGDGFADVIVGTDDHSSGAPPGVAGVYLGPSGASVYTWSGDSAGDGFGRGVAGVGDVNGDGRGDLAVGAPYDDVAGAESGSVRVLSGATGVVIYTAYGDAFSWRFGESVAGAGDVNGDGLADVIAGAPLGWDPDVGTQTGAARVLSGSSGATIHTFFGASTFDALGQSVASAGDVDRDGRSDLLVGAPAENAGFPATGYVRVYAGRTGSLLFTYAPAGPGSDSRVNFGESVARIGDIDGNGLVDLAAGAPYFNGAAGVDSGGVWVFAPAPVFSPFCFPGVDALACPCTNPPGGPGRGCDNSAGTGGAQLVATGYAGFSGDTLVLTSSGERATAFSIFLQGDGLANNIYGQGVRCVGGSLRRLYMKAASGGVATAPVSGDPSVTTRSAALGDAIPPGGTRRYMVYYRDPVVLGGCPANRTFNTSQGIQITWAP